MYPPTGRVFFCLIPPGAGADSCSFPIYWYGVLIVSGVLLGAYVAARYAQSRGLDPDHVWGGLMWALVLAIIGARLYHVLTPSPSTGMTPLKYFSFGDFDGDHIPDILDIRDGGLGIYGAIFGGLLGVAIYCWRNKLSFWTFADLGGYGMPLGQAIGRWGNFFNQELYGPPTDLPWGVRIDAAHRIPPYTDLTRYPVATTLFQPAFLYESLWDLLTFLAIVFVARRFRDRLRTGELLALYVAMYALGRILLEFVRTDAATLPVAGMAINIAQLVSALVIVGVIVIVAVRRRLSPAPQPAAPDEPPAEAEHSAS